MNLRLVSLAFVVASFASLAGCSAKALQPGAERVMVTHLAPADGCVYVGSVIGEQGGAASGPYTSNARLAEGALNDMKNKAHAMGANYVLLEDTHAGNTVRADRYGASGGQTDVTHMGNAFRCPDRPSGPSSAAADVVVVGM